MTSSLTSKPGDVRQHLAEFSGRFDLILRQMLATPADVPAELSEAVQYAVLAPGKRVRPYLVVQCCRLAGGNDEDAWPAAAAVECVHAFSLVHDDLPAMDDDDLRRGRPTTHKQFGEATAILAGDALAVCAFEVLSRYYRTHPGVAEIVGELAMATGWSGMIGGQAADLAGEKCPADLALTQSIHRRKTARLFAASCRLGGMAARARTEMVDRLGRFGTLLGEAFQIADDVLDVTATPEQIGKSAGKDLAAGKQTYPRCIGAEASRQAALRLVSEGITVLEPFGPQADDLRHLSRYLAIRDY